ncbi:MAG: PQQ-binding-like beta-propeller repeat protein, partial [bacterium]
CMVDTIAYLACEQMGLQIINLAQPIDSLALVGWVDTPSNARHVYAIDNYAYVADGRGGLIIIDVTDIENPTVVSQFDTPEYANAVFVSDNRAYIGDGDGGLYVVDVSVPSQPEFYGKLPTSYANGVYVRNDTVFVADQDLGLVILVEEEQ